MFIACLSIMKPKENYGKLLAIPSEDMTGKYARYWLASANSGLNLRNVDENGNTINSNNIEFGVRRMHIKNKICKRQKIAGRTQGPPLQAQAEILRITMKKVGFGTINRKCRINE